MLRIGIPASLIAIVFLIVVISVFVISNRQKVIYTDQNGVPYNTIDTITRKVFFDIQIGREYKGRIIMALFGKTCPITVRNFAELCSG